MNKSKYCYVNKSKYCYVNKSKYCYVNKSKYCYVCVYSSIPYHIQQFNAIQVLYTILIY